MTAEEETQGSLPTYDEDDEIVQILRKEKPKSEQHFAVVQPFINQILKVDDATQTVELDLYTRVHWQNPDWKGKNDEEFQEKKDDLEFDPTVEIVNGVALEKKMSELWLDYEDQGIIGRVERSIGTIAVDMDLHDFPFDTQTVNIDYESFWWFRENLLLHPCPSQRKQAAGEFVSLNPKANIKEWTAELIKIEESLHTIPAENQTYSFLQLQLRLRRNFAYYFYKIMVVVFLTVAMSWSVFVMPPSELGERISISVTLFLAAVAFNYVIGSSLPRVSYFTKMDHFILVSYLAIVATLVESIVAYVIQKRNTEAAEWLDVLVGLGLIVIYIFYNTIFIVANLWRRAQKSSV